MDNTLAVGILDNIVAVILICFILIIIGLFYIYEECIKPYHLRVLYRNQEIRSAIIAESFSYRPATAVIKNLYEVDLDTTKMKILEDPQKNEHYIMF